jgi:hypothetical protein
MVWCPDRDLISYGDEVADVRGMVVWLLHETGMNPLQTRMRHSLLSRLQTVRYPLQVMLLWMTAQILMHRENGVHCGVNITYTPYGCTHG